MPGSPWELYVFREGKRRISGALLVRELLACMERIRSGSEDALVSALVRAGEVESAAFDHAPNRAQPAVAVADELASGLVARTEVRRERVRAHLDTLRRACGMPEIARLSPPESFSYYALHPRDFADAVRSWPNRRDGSVAVIGIRTIGSTLSAVVAAALRHRGVDVERITVRPGGPPFARWLDLDGDALTFVRRHVTRGSRFIASTKARASAAHLFSRSASACTARAANASRFSRRASSIPRICRPRTARGDGARSTCGWCAPARASPADAAQPLGAGAWRLRFLPAPALRGADRWPASWYGLERAKFLGADGRTLYKFEGLGRYGDEPRRRIAVLASVGFSAPGTEAGSGYVAYPVIEGRPARARDRDPAMLDRLADYCAFRARATRAESVDDDAPELATMLEVNARHELGGESPPTLDIAVPVIADARMMPHEWVVSAAGLVKVDAASHGDDQRFPGACDIAWDLAGTILEWQPDAAAAEHFLRRYEARSGDRPRRRLAPYMRAYALSRAAECRMGAAAMHRTEEAPRFLAEYERWRTALTRYAPRESENE